MEAHLILGQYRTYLAATGGLIFVQALLMAGLMVQRSYRRRAERTLAARESALTASQRHIHGLAGRLIAAQEIERSRIARELHDDLGQKIAMLAIDVQRLVRDESATGTTLAKTRVVAARAAEIATQVHTMSHQLHPAKLRILGLAKALEFLCRDVALRYGIEVEFQPEDLPAHIPADAALCLFRVTQEALNNIVKHSGAARAGVRVRAGDDGELALAIVDDGCGFDPLRAADGIGLESMRERMHFAGGEIEIVSTPGNGSRISAKVPLLRRYDSSRRTG